jgi:hypothetical protein
MNSSYNSINKRGRKGGGDSGNGGKHAEYEQRGFEDPWPESGVRGPAAGLGKDERASEDEERSREGVRTQACFTQWKLSHPE